MLLEELIFIIYFGLRSMKLSQSHDLGYKFDWLTRVGFCVIF